LTIDDREVPVKIQPAVVFLVMLAGCGGGGGGSSTPSTPTPTPPPPLRLYAAGDGNPSNAIAYFTAPFTASSTPTGSIATASGGEIAGLAIDSHGNVIASDQNENTITSYARPTPTTSTLFALSPGFTPTGIAYDVSGNFYVADYTDGKVDKASSVPLSSATTFTTLIASTLAPAAICFDEAQNLYVVNGTGGIVSAYAPPYTGTPISVNVGVSNVFGCAVSTPYNQLAVYHPGIGTGSVYIYNLPLTAASMPAVTFAFTTTSPTGLGADSSGNLYVGVDTPGIQIYTPPFANASTPTLTIPAVNAVHDITFGT
jgi:sugar lactone lactonase YvrE